MSQRFITLFMEKFILTINLELILHMHNISCGVKRIPPNVQTNISNLDSRSISTTYNDAIKVTYCQMQPSLDNWKIYCGLDLWFRGLMEKTLDWLDPSSRNALKVITLSEGIEVNFVNWCVMFLRKGPGPIPLYSAWFALCIVDTVASAKQILCK